MFHKKFDVIVGLTTFNHEMLKISVPALGKLGKKFALVIFNDNPSIKLKRRTVRRLGYRGRLGIINTNENIGVIGARAKILKHTQKCKFDASWILFANDDDAVLSIDVPTVASNNFAILQNSVFVRARTLDLLRILENPTEYTIDDDVMQLIKPHIGFKGTFIRYDIACKFGEILEQNAQQFAHIFEKFNANIPANVLMWSGLNTYVRGAYPEMTPIYMDNTNYMIITTVSPRVVMTKTENLANRFDAIIASAFAAPEGQD
jgi:hypothetical protein